MNAVMNFSLSHVSDAVLLIDLDKDCDREGIDTAWQLARIAEAEARRLHLPAGYSTMREYCAGHLGLPDEVAYKRIRVARASRTHPAILQGIAERKYHVSTLVILIPFLTPENGDELLAAAANQSRKAIEWLLAEHFPRPDVPAHFQSVDPPAELGLGGEVETSPNSPGEDREVEAFPEGQSPVPGQKARMRPLSPGRVEWHMTVDQETQDLPGPGTSQPPTACARAGEDPAPCARAHGEVVEKVPFWGSRQTEEPEVRIREPESPLHPRRREVRRLAA